MDKFELVALRNGTTSLRCLDNRETFHPGIGPAEEANILHVEQQRIVERVQKMQGFCLWDVGLGAAANVVMAIKALENNIPSGHKVCIFSFDKTLKPLEFALQNAGELKYLLGLERQIEKLIKDGKVNIGSNIEWHLRGEFTKEISTPSTRNLRAPDAIFYDPYSAKGNPEMWSLDTFINLRKILEPDRMCLLTNYTASTYIRVTLLLAGFFVGYGCTVDKKLHTTVASNTLDALKKPLDKAWLTERVRVSHSAAPIRTIPHEIAPLSEDDYKLLLKHPQFAPHESR
ncbi:hypothetical protein GW916_02765 [bacterium]|nr:hypothetical protein [bacterium]